VSLSCLGSAEISRSREITGRFLFFRRVARQQVSFWFIPDLSLRQVICRRWFWLWCRSWPLSQGTFFFSSSADLAEFLLILFFLFAPRGCSISSPQGSSFPLASRNRRPSVSWSTAPGSFHFRSRLGRFSARASAVLCACLCPHCVAASVPQSASLPQVVFPAHGLSSFLCVLSTCSVLQSVLPRRSFYFRFHLCLDPSFTS
jgi:hypothetical protein